MDEVAKRAGVAKGTIYLYFPSKEELFKGLIENVASPPLEALQALVDTSDADSEQLLRTMFAFVKRELLGTERRQVIHLILTEVHRFPDVALFYYENVVSRALGFLRTIMERGVARGEFRDCDLVRFSQLVAAPLPMAVFWSAIFEPFAPLDVDRFMDTHLDLLLTKLKVKS